jgi:hypothetical protein
MMFTLLSAFMFGVIESLVVCLLYFSTAALVMFGILPLFQVHIVSDILQLSEGIFILVGAGNLFMPAN